MYVCAAVWHVPLLVHIHYDSAEGACKIHGLGLTQNLGFLTCARKVGHVALDVLAARNTVGDVALNFHFCGMNDIRPPDPVVFPAESRSCDLTPRINDVWPSEFGPTTCNSVLATGFACFEVMPALYLFLSRGYGCDACKQFRGFFHCARLVAALDLWRDCGGAHWWHRITEPCSLHCRLWPTCQVHRIAARLSRSVCAFA